MGEWVPSKPDWWSVISDNSEALTSFLEDPAGFILEKILSVLVAGVLWAVDEVARLVQVLIATFGIVPTTISSAVSDAFAGAGELLLWIPTTLEDGLESLVDALGPWAVFVIVPAAVLVSVAVYRGAKALSWTASPRLAGVISRIGGK